MRRVEMYPEAHDGLSDNDFDIVERYSEDELYTPAPAIEIKKNVNPRESQSFPKAMHRSKMGRGLGRGERHGNSPKHIACSKQSHGNHPYGSDAEDGDQEYQAYSDTLPVEGIVDISKMTDKEIKAEQESLYKKLGKETCDFLIQRRLKKMREEQTNENHQGTRGPVVEPPRYTPSNSPAPAEEPKKKEVSLYADANELRKMEWTNPVESTQGKTRSTAEMPLHELRFDFEGFLVYENAPGPPSRYASSLYNHGLDPDKPGYTIPELLELIRSTFRPQVQIATRTLCNIVHRAQVMSKRYFGLDSERWNNYILHDVDIVSKMGYVAMSNANTVQVVTDALKCMGLVMVGDLIPESYDAIASESGGKQCCLEEILLPMQDSLMELLPQDMVADVYSWNPFTANVAEFIGQNDYSKRKGSCATQETLNNSDTGESNTSESVVNVKPLKQVHWNSTQTHAERLSAFYLSALEGEFDGMEVDEIRKRLAEAMDIEKTDSYMQQNINSSLYLMTHFSFFRRLCCTMEQYKTNMALQMYACTVIAGFIIRIGSPMVEALLKFQPFRERFTELCSSLIIGTSEYQRLHDEMVLTNTNELLQVQQLHVSTVVIYCMKLVSIFKKDAFRMFLDDIGAIALVKQTMTQTYGAHLMKLFENSRHREQRLPFITPSLAISAISSLQILRLWVIQGTDKDTLDELMPVLELEMYRVVEFARVSPEAFIDFMDTNGLVLGYIFSHMACLLRHSDMSKHVRFNWSNDLFHEFVSELCKGAMKDLEEHRLMKLIASTFDFQNNYINSVIQSDEVTTKILTNGQKQALKHMAQYTSSLVEHFCKLEEEVVLQSLEFRWFDWEPLSVNIQPVAPFCARLNGISKLIIPVKMSCWMMDIIGHVIQIKDPLQDELKSTLARPFTALTRKLTQMLRHLHTTRVNSPQSSGFDKGSKASKPLPLLESWVHFIHDFSQNGIFGLQVEEYSQEDVTGSLIAALTVASTYTSITNLLKRLYAVQSVKQTHVLGAVVRDFTNFNKSIADNHSLGSTKLAVVNFVSHVPVSAISSLVSNEKRQELSISSAFLELLVQNERFANQFIQWIPEFDAANHLIQAVINAEYELSWKVDPIVVKALETLVFKRLSTMLTVSSSGPCDDRTQATIPTKTWDDLIEHLKQVVTVTKNEDVLLSGAPRSGRIGEHEHDALGKATKAVISKFNSGLGDSPYVMTSLMLLISVFSRPDCAVHVWADTSLMLLLGRNVTVDVVTREVTCVTASETLSLGPIYMYLPEYNLREEIRRKQQRLLNEFNDEDSSNGNAIKAIVVAIMGK